MTTLMQKLCSNIDCFFIMTLFIICFILAMIFLYIDGDISSYDAMSIFNSIIHNM